MARYLAGLGFLSAADHRCRAAVAGQGRPGPGVADAAAARPGRPLCRGRCPSRPKPTPKSREQKRFARADKDEDGRITADELFEPRRKAFAKLDTNGNGALSFEEWAVRTVDKFRKAPTRTARAG